MFKFERDAKFTYLLRGAAERICDPSLLHVSVLDYSEIESVRGPIYAGLNDEVCVYPASLYKLYVAGALLGMVSREKLSLEDSMLMQWHNAVDLEKEVPSDPRPLLSSGERYRVGYLLDLMITRSDNSAANALIDYVTRPVINKFMTDHGWSDSQVTRKFLSRKREDNGYENAPMTVTTSRHLVEFLYSLVTGRVGSLYWSLQLQRLMARQLDTDKMRRGFSKRVDFFHKTGWFSFEKESKLVGVTGDCGVVHFNGHGCCLVSCVVALPEPEGEQVLCEFGRELEKVFRALRHTR